MNYSPLCGRLRKIILSPGLEIKSVPFFPIGGAAPIEAVAVKTGCNASGMRGSHATHGNQGKIPISQA